MSLGSSGSRPPRGPDDGAMYLGGDMGGLADPARCAAGTPSAAVSDAAGSVEAAADAVVAFPAASAAFAAAMLANLARIACC